MSNAVEMPAEFEPFFGPATVGPDGTSLVGCIDKNEAAEGCPVLAPNGEALNYFQLPGGANIGLMVATAWEATSPGFLAENTENFQEPLLPGIGKLATSALTGLGYRMVIHGPICLATTYEQDIANSGSNATKPVLARAQLVDPTFTPDKHNSITSAMKRVLETVTFLGPQAVEKYMTDEQGPDNPAVAKATLKQGPRAKAIIANYGRNAFDPAAANKAGSPAYCVSMDLVNEIPKAFPVDNEALRHTLALIIGVISTHPNVRGQRGRRLPIYVRDLPK